MLFNHEEVRRILERGLVNGYWSVADFQSPHNKTPTLPSWQFLEQHPQFQDMNFRDLEAYRNLPKADYPIF